MGVIFINGSNHPLYLAFTVIFKSKFYFQHNYLYILQHESLYPPQDTRQAGTIWNGDLAGKQQTEYTIFTGFKFNFLKSSLVALDV